MLFCNWLELLTVEAPLPDGICSFAAPLSESVHLLTSRLLPLSGGTDNELPPYFNFGGSSFGRQERHRVDPELEANLFRQDLQQTIRRTGIFSYDLYYIV